ncbi:MAG: hypothetical protein JJU25_16375 [Halomonas sp.]|nr:hypothetical protein [Halomonas sp.]MCC5884195.1 hypothetical protein [Halomonas sp.]
MFQRTRKVECPECSGSSFWKSNPKPTDVLQCCYCQAVIATYEEYVERAAKQEAERLLAEYVETDISRDLAHLKAVLAQPGERANA